MKLTTKNQFLLAVAGLLVAFCSVAIAQSTDSADGKFAATAASGGMEEVELGKIAASKASNEKVKAFGERMATDHAKAGEQLKMIAQKDNMTLPTSLNAKDKATVDRLSSLSGQEFDKAYMQGMVKDHQADIAAFEKESSNGTNPELKKWASETLPTLKEHLRMAQDAASAVNGQL